jgi:DNA (cytosine-5)-methyltransferase 1
MPARQMRFIDLFCGLGGFHVGLARLGHRCVLACEKDATLRALYERNFGITPDTDIRRLSTSCIPRHDILCAGFPCQPFSKAGEQMGLKCDRDGDLFSHILRILRRHRPPTLLLENVANLVRHNGGATYQWMRSQLERLGYDVACQILSPHEFGIPQIRARAFIVGRLAGLHSFEWPTPTNDEPSIRSVLDRAPTDAKPLPPHYRKCIDVWQEFLDRIPASDPLPSFPIWSFEFGATYPVDGLPPAARPRRSLSRFHGSFGVALASLDRPAQLELLPSYARGPKPFPRWKQLFILQNRDFFNRHSRRLRTWLPSIRDFSASLQKLEWNCQGEVRDLASHIMQFRASGVRVKRSNWAPALVAMTTTQVPVITWQNRYMSVRECARLQGIGNLSLTSLNPTDAYRAIGNAVSADLVHLIAQRLLHNKASTRVHPRRCCQDLASPKSTHRAPPRRGRIQPIPVSHAGVTSRTR